MDIEIYYTEHETHYNKDNNFIWILKYIIQNMTSIIMEISKIKHPFNYLKIYFFQKEIR